MRRNLALCIAALSIIDGRTLMREIILPWPNRVLHPNARKHWRAKSPAAKRANSDAFFLAAAAGWGAQGIWPTHGRLHVWIDGYPPDKRKRDHDGFLSNLKHELDGIARAMGVDDSRFVPHPWIKDEVRKPGEVRIRVTMGPSE